MSSRRILAVTVALAIMLSFRAAEKGTSPAIGWGVAFFLFLSACFLKRLSLRPSVPCSAGRAAVKLVMSYVVSMLIFFAVASLIARGGHLRGDGLDVSILMLFGAAHVLAYAIYKLALKGPDRLGRRKPGLGTSLAATRGVSAFRPARSGDTMERWCRDAGWLLTGRESGRYEVRSGDHQSHVYIEIRYEERSPNIVFQSWFGIRFSLEKPPAGLFARILLRSTSLNWTSWGMHIGQSCEACLVVRAILPTASMNAGLFREACEEIAGEIRGFRAEINDKFAYDLGGVAPEATPREARGGVPARRGDSAPGKWQGN